MVVLLIWQCLPLLAVVLWTLFPVSFVMPISHPPNQSLSSLRDLRRLLHHPKCTWHILDNKMKIDNEFIGTELGYANRIATYGKWTPKAGLWHAARNRSHSVPSLLTLSPGHPWECASPSCFLLVYRIFRVPTPSFASHLWVYTKYLLHFDSNSLYNVFNALHGTQSPPAAKQLLMYSTAAVNGSLVATKCTRSLVHWSTEVKEILSEIQHSRIHTVHDIHFEHFFWSNQ